MAALTKKLLSYFLRRKLSPNLNGSGACHMLRDFTTARKDEPPEYISASQVKQVLRYEDLIPIIEKSFVNFSDREGGGIVQPVRLQVPVKEHKGLLYVMPCYSAKDTALATKVTAVYYSQDNVRHRVPSHLLYFNASTGDLLAIMDGTVISEMRTAAASAVATKHLASEDTGVLCILGSGAQARSHAQALKFVRPFSQVRVWSRTAANAQKFAEEIGATACETAEQAASGADVIVTVTASSTPVLLGKWIKPGAHINGAGAARPTWRELDDDVMHSSIVIADSFDAAMVESGAIVLSGAKVTGELGEVISGKIKVDKTKTTLFKSLGMAVQDVVSAKLVYEKTQETKS